MTAEELMAEIRLMPAEERGRFFVLLGAQLFPDDDLTHEQLFGPLAEAEFTGEEAAEYLEVSIATLRRHVHAGRLKPSRVIGRSQMFATRELKSFKRSLRR